MSFFKRTVYKSLFLKEDVEEIIHHYDNEDKQSLTNKYDTIHPRFYQDIFNELVKAIPVEDALKLLNYAALQKSKEQLRFTWEYTEERRKEVYQSIQYTDHPGGHTPRRRKTDPPLDRRRPMQQKQESAPVVHVLGPTSSLQPVEAPEEETKQPETIKPTSQTVPLTPNHQPTDPTEEIGDILFR